MDDLSDDLSNADSRAVVLSLLLNLLLRQWAEWAHYYACVHILKKDACVWMVAS